MPNTEEEILHVGFEGEGVSVFRIQLAEGTFAYSVRANSSMLIETMDDQEAEETRKAQHALSQIRYASFEDALSRLGSTVFSGYPTYIHPDFRDRIWTEFQHSCELLPSQPINRRHAEVWKEICLTR